MSPRHYDSPVAAATAGIPPQAIRVLAVRASEDDAYVLFDARPGGPAYEYGVHCHREAKGWVEGSSSNSGGWSSTDIDSELGVFTLWGKAPTGATRVRFEFEGAITEEPVENGYCVGAWWRRPCSDGPWPREAAFLIDGEWRAAPGLDESNDASRIRRRPRV